jgi:PTH2 family peptidyl-tRNA hydrolase
MGLFSRDDEYKVVVLVRQDVKMSKGKTAAQACHAAVSCAIQAYRKHPSQFSEWDSWGQKVVCLKVPNKEELFQYKAIADAQGIISAVVADAGRTEVDPGTVTCMGLGPEKQSVLDKITGELGML